MRKQFCFIILCIVIGTISCKKAADGSFVKKDVILEFSDSSLNSVANIGNNLKSIQVNKQVLLYAFSWKDKAIFIGNMEHGLAKVELCFLSPEIEFSHETDVILLSQTKAYLIDNKRRVLKIDLHRKTYEIIDLNSGLDDALYPISYWAYPMIALSDDILEIPCTYVDLYLTNEGAFRTYFSRPSVLQINLSNDIVHSTAFGMYPERYQRGMFFDDLYCRLTRISENKRILSFSCSDSIVLYTDEKEERCFMGYIPKPKFISYNLKELADMQYKRKYTIEQPRYLQVVYDPHRDLIYRVYKHSANFTNSDGKVTAYKDIEWSLILSDKDFKKQKSILFDKGIYSPIGMIPVPEGLFIQKYAKLNADEITGSIFEIYME